MAKKKGKQTDVGSASVVIRNTGDKKEIELNPSAKGAAAGAAAGAALGSVVPVIGTTVGAVVGGIAGFLFGPSDS